MNIELVKSAGFSQIVKEPIISDADKNGGLRADWGVRGFWEHQSEALFDCRIFNADAISYVNTQQLFLKIKEMTRRSSTTQQ